jgi:hypothetical protein
LLPECAHAAARITAAIRRKERKGTRSPRSAMRLPK